MTRGRGKRAGGVLGLLKDRRVQVAAGAAAVLGLVVMMRRGGGGSGVDGAQIQPAAGFDSSGTDLYNALQGIQEGWSADMRAFTEQLSIFNRGRTTTPTSPDDVRNFRKPGFRPYPAGSRPAPTFFTPPSPLTPVRR
ncbi:hypothetical protein C5N14_30915 [Micromonospora sp. MW-13]|uniref:hypothetical protein n=1 Tax=Micromonospora sp. MW-13 TaxID=2094022 RepID=UPI000E431BC8|nr:hypothetical protein [Micromonospora sp. MW-13]RGC65005.1 hypothetical protein C5N14_30915 [Micromonospora sp. MW-13]